MLLIYSFLHFRCTFHHFDHFGWLCIEGSMLTLRRKEADFAITCLKISCMGGFAMKGS